MRGLDNSNGRNLDLGFVLFGKCKLPGRFHGQQLFIVVSVFDDGLEVPQGVYIDKIGKPEAT